MELSRRDFLKIAAVAGASLVLRGSESRDFMEPVLAEKEIKPEQGVLFMMPSLVEGDFKLKGETRSEILLFENAVGHRVHGLSFFSDLDKKPPTPETIINTLNSGRVIMINLQPRVTGNPKDTTTFNLQAFSSGRHLDKISSLARMMKSFGNENIYIRFGFEMNGDWFSWGTDTEGFKEIWKYVVNVFREEGANNVKWIFSPNYSPDPHKIYDYFPGDEYVDVVGPDIYDWEEASPEIAINRINYYLRSLSRKPLIVSEIGADGPNQDSWVSYAIYKSMRQGASAVNYFQFNKEKNWKLERGKVPMTRKLIGSGIFLRGSASLRQINQKLLTVN